MTDEFPPELDPAVARRMRRRRARNDALAAICFLVISIGSIVAIVSMTHV